jgi:hypothetical protein
LITGAFILVARSVHALRNVGRLVVKEHIDLGLLPVETVLLIADGLDRLARDLLDLGLHGLLVHRAAHFAGNDDPVGGGKGFAGDAHVPWTHAGFRGFAEKQVHHFVGYAVADFIRVTFRHRFAGEDIVGAGH